jgi:S-formylglutathione hydrolase FrmB
MRRDITAPAGEIRRFTLESRVLGGNPLGDPTSRELNVYLPPGYDDAKSLPLLVDLVGFTGSGQSHTNWRAFTENAPERLDRLIHEGRMGPVVVAFPDCYTRLGGNQYINSAGTGRYADYLMNEVVPFVEQRVAAGGAGKRACFGKSSGGYGAMIHALKYADFWSAAACHSGDMGFDICYLYDMPSTLRELAKHGRSIEKFVAYFEQSKKPTEKEINVIMMLAMAAHYDPDPSQFLGLRLPVDLETCALIAERWEIWLKHDPLRLLPTHAANLKKLKGLYIDCGNEDQFHLQYGARQLSKALEALEIAHVYEEFADDHSSVDYRMDVSLPFLERALTKN